ncbi:MAG TPA: NADPH-dependent FMN reductase [Myxococcota bacterium]
MRDIRASAIVQIRLLGIAGSLRATSSNAAIMRAARRDGVDLDVYEGLGALPHFSPDLDVDPLPPEVAGLRARIASADAIFVSSPEYAHGMPGSLKNALDWLVSAQEALNKRAMLLSASPGGAAFAHAQLLEVLRTMNLDVVDAGAHVFTRARLDERGNVVDAPILAALDAGLKTLRARSAQLEATRAK